MEEEHIRAWYVLPASRGSGAGKHEENMSKCWAVGGKLLEQLGEAESEDDESE